MERKTETFLPSAARQCESWSPYYVTKPPGKGGFVALFRSSTCKYSPQTVQGRGSSPSRGECWFMLQYPRIPLKYEHAHCLVLLLRRCQWSAVAESVTRCKLTC